MRDLSLHLLDIVQNSLAAGANEVGVEIALDQAEDLMIVTVTDNGNGIDKKILGSVTDPFTTTRTTRRFGLGLPLLKDSAERAGGSLKIKSRKGNGTNVKACFKISSIDRIPLGDAGGTMTALIMGSPKTRFRLSLKKGASSFCLDSLEIKDRLGEVAVTEYSVLEWIRSYVNEAVKEIFGGVLNEVDSRA